MTEQPTIVIDCDNVCHRNWHALSKSRSFDNPVEYAFLRGLSNLAERLSSRRFAFCFDGVVSPRRKIFPSYKDRVVTPEKVIIRNAITRLRTEILPAIGYKNIFWQADAEADDVIGHLVKTKEDADAMVLVSNDSDLYQLLSIPNVTVWSPVIKMLLDRNWVWEQYDISPRQWTLYKALVGCKTDDIPGVRGVGPVLAARFIRNKLPEDATVQKRILDSTDRIELNTSLVTIPLEGLTLPNWEIQEDRINPDVWNQVVASIDMAGLEDRFPK